MYAIRSYYAGKWHNSFLPGLMPAVNSAHRAGCWHLPHTSSLPTAKLLLLKPLFFVLTKTSAVLPENRVITSYSIHYTKLYERKVGRSTFPTKQIPWESLRVAVGNCCSAAIFLTSGLSKWPIGNKALLSCSCRITSYNVCYTKLLRTTVGNRNSQVIDMAFITV